MSLIAELKRQSGFTADPSYLEVVEKYAYGAVLLWEQRVPPDFCEKVRRQ